MRNFICRCMNNLHHLKHEYFIVKNKFETLFRVSNFVQSETPCIQNLFDCLSYNYRIKIVIGNYCVHNWFSERVEVFNFENLPCGDYMLRKILRFCPLILSFIDFITNHLLCFLTNFEHVIWSFRRDLWWFRARRCMPTSLE